MRVTYFQAVDSSTIKWLETLIKKVKEEKPESLEILINSTGGSSQGTEIMFEQVQELEALTDVTITNTHQVASAAVDLFMLFKKRNLVKGSFFLIHNASYIFNGESPEFIKRYMKEQERINDEWMEAFLRFTVSNGMTKAQYNKAKRRLKEGGDVFIFEEEARKWGLTNVQAE